MIRSKHSIYDKECIDKIPEPTPEAAEQTRKAIMTYTDMNKIDSIYAQVKINGIIKEE